MKHSLADLNSYLFEQIDIITDDNLQGEKLEEALEKAKTVNKIASTIVQNADVQLRAYAEFGGRGTNEQAIKLLVGGK